MVVARSQLRDNAGIEIPDLSLVAKAIGVYLALLIPVNFLIFRVVGRVEYAWFAIPILAIGGAVAVARIARLDIGFARSQTELAILELQPDYPRGHLSRMVAVYNSLTTPYEVSFDDPDGVAAPVGLFDGKSAGPEATFRTAGGKGPELSGFSVDSNRVGMLRCEQVIDLGGSVRLDEESGITKLINSTKYDLEAGYILRRTESGLVEFARFGGAVSGESVRLSFRATNSKPTEGASDLQKIPDEDPFGMMRSIAIHWHLRPGETRLLSVIPKSLPGFTMTPSSGQQTGQTVVVATLVHPPTEPAEPDLNLISDFRDVRREIIVEKDDPSDAGKSTDGTGNPAASQETELSPSDSKTEPVKTP